MDRPEIVKADPRLKRLSLIGVVAGVLAGAGLIWAFGAWMARVQALARVSPDQARQQLGSALAWLSLLMGAGLAAFGLYLTRLAVRTLRAGRYPLPGMRVIRDTPVVTGAQARRRARFGLALAALLVLLGGLFPVMAWQIRKLAEG
jgi:hypothetical protein